MPNFLADLVEDFLDSYYRMYPDMSMKPKFHYLIHYPEHLVNFGPLVHTWTLRFEGKHNYFKEVASLTNQKAQRLSDSLPNGDALLH
ncbi:hypothetical protein HOLleu_43867 [Holothuria leucospilota]|uniref:Uncharacterized protein n=1 Tax=Holothuria leucospilota TaxID=206669 RepID=A0A9Q1B8W5_HOLLE|nr:hypothetical protein HOLleu_43867 [Holothuria leucospilota]